VLLSLKKSEFINSEPELHLSKTYNKKVNKKELLERYIKHV
jgi:uncharacterized protein YktA (UPF0223 family)